VFLWEASIIVSETLLNSLLKANLHAEYDERLLCSGSLKGVGFLPFPKIPNDLFLQGEFFNLFALQILSKDSIVLTM